MRTANSLPPCRPDSRSATALYQVRDGVRMGGWKLLSEPVYVLDGHWTVRRGGKLIPADAVDPQPSAMLEHDGEVVIGVSRWWPDLPSFCRANGLDADTQPTPAPWSEPVKAVGGG